MPKSHRANMDAVEVTHNDIRIMTHENGSPPPRAETIRFVGIVPDPLPPKVAALVDGICDQ